MRACRLSKRPAAVKPSCCFSLSAGEGVSEHSCVHFGWCVQSLLGGLLGVDLLGHGAELRSSSMKTPFPQVGYATPHTHQKLARSTSAPASHVPASIYAGEQSCVCVCVYLSILLGCTPQAYKALCLPSFKTKEKPRVSDRDSSGLMGGGPYMSETRSRSDPLWVVGRT